MEKEEVYIHRCFSLARMAGKETNQNPMVGAILVYGDKIIGEGYHEYAGGPHAEVRCIESVIPEDRKFIPEATLYVSLEPCCYFGKTPPCTSLILSRGIKKVVVSVTDPNEKVSGKGIEILRNNGVNVKTGILRSQGKELIAPFSIQQKENRPYVILKVVKSRDNFVGKRGEKIWLTNTYSDVLTHKWRSEVHGILAGTETLINDNPSLTTRNYPGDNPQIIIVDRFHRIPTHNKILSSGHPFIYFSHSERDLPHTVHQETLPEENQLSSLLQKCLKLGIYTMLVEGGPTLWTSFYREELWDEARIITTPHLLKQGIKSPDIDGFKKDNYYIDNDRVTVISRVLR